MNIDNLNGTPEKQHQKFFPAFLVMPPLFFIDCGLLKGYLTARGTSHNAYVNSRKVSGYNFELHLPLCQHAAVRLVNFAKILQTSLSLDFSVSIEEQPKKIGSIRNWKVGGLRGLSEDEDLWLELERKYVVTCLCVCVYRYIK